MFILDVFKFDPQYLENEEKYKAIKKGTGDNSYCLLFILFWYFYGYYCNCTSFVANSLFKLMFLIWCWQCQRLWIVVCRASRWRRFGWWRCGGWWIRWRQRWGWWRWWRWRWWRRLVKITITIVFFICCVILIVRIFWCEQKFSESNGYDLCCWLNLILCVSVDCLLDWSCVSFILLFCFSRSIISAINPQSRI